ALYGDPAVFECLAEGKLRTVSMALRCRKNGVRCGGRCFQCPDLLVGPVDEVGPGRLQVDVPDRRSSERDEWVPGGSKIVPSLPLLDTEPVEPPRGPVAGGPGLPQLVLCGLRIGLELIYPS